MSFTLNALLLMYPLAVSRPLLYSTSKEVFVLLTSLKLSLNHEGFRVVFCIQKNSLSTFDIDKLFIFGGDKRDRTADLLNAIQALSQLSYTPICLLYYIRFLFANQEIFLLNLYYLKHYIFYT